MAAAKDPAGNPIDADDGYDCGACNGPNSADIGMVSCDACLVWYHLKCAGQTPGVEKRPWMCSRCQPADPATKPTGTKKKKKGGKSTTLNPPADDDATSKKSKSRKSAPGGASKIQVPQDPQTPLKNPEILKPASQPAKSVRSTASSARARNLLAQKRLEEERKLAEEKLEEEERRLAEEEALQEKKRKLREQKLKMKEEFLKQWYELEENALEEGEECDSHAGSEMIRKWLEDQRRQIADKPPSQGKISVNTLKTQSKGKGSQDNPPADDEEDVNPEDGECPDDEEEDSEGYDDAEEGGEGSDDGEDDGEGSGEGDGEGDSEYSGEDDGDEKDDDDLLDDSAAGTGGTPQPSPPNPRQKPANPQPGPPNPRQKPANPRPVPGNPRPIPENPRPSPGNPRPRPANPQPSPGNPRPRPANPQQSPAHPQPRSANTRPARNPRAVPASLPTDEEVVLTASQIAARKVWPRKYPVFRGDPADWPIFLSSFELATKTCGLTNVDNIIRLRECLEGEAKARVASKLMFPECVPTIIENLKRYYGRPQDVVKGLVEKVSQMVAPDPEDLAALRDFGIAVVQLCDHLVAAKLSSHLANPSLLQDLVEKLPASYKMQWVGFRRAFAEPTLKEFGEFMDVLVADACEVISTKAKKSKQEKGKQAQKGHVNAHSSNGAKGDAPRQPCPICSKDDHRVRNCEKFRGMSLKSRLEAVEKAKLCKVCLFNHGRWNCRSKIRCNVDNCGEPHNPLLHQAKKTTLVSSPTVTAECNAHGQVSRSVLFKVIPVTLHNGRRSFNTYAFLDEGSSLTLVEAGVAKDLGLSGEPEPLKLIWTSSVARTEKSSKRVDISISARGDRQLYQLKGAHTVKELNLPKQSLAVAELAERFSHLRELPVVSYADAEPKVLIGLQNLELFTPLEIRAGQPGDPVAVRSALGWVVYGPKDGGQVQGGFLGVHDCQRMVDDGLNELLRQQYLLDEAVVSTAPLPESGDDARAREILERTTRRVGDRWETGLLWKSDDVEFPSSWNMAVRRHKSFEAKLARKPGLRENVCQQIRDYVTKGYAHKATEEELRTADPKRVWFLPVNVVEHPKKPEKKRLTWDAKAAVNGVSLNSQLLKGPDKLRSLPSVICTFREGPVAFGGDIKEMFHQVQIIPEDKHAQRFLFRFDPLQEPDVYIMDVATFGATCSPCSVQHVMQMNALESAEEFPEAASAIISKTYMDDYFDSADTPQEAATRAKEVRTIHARGGFEMRNWVSNSEEVLHSLGESKTEKQLKISMDQQDGWERVLGLVWNPHGDYFTFSTEFHGNLAQFVTGDGWPTKRDVARCVMSLFDPTGMLAPYLIHGKMLIQDLWRSGTQWDERVPDNEHEKWRKWVTLLPSIALLKIPRHYFGGSSPSRFRSIQLHIFTDASEQGLGCVAYFRAVDEVGVRCALVMSKSKVAPIKYQSIPRLELQAATLGARLATRIQSCHTLSISSTTLWTDSSTVLSWIRSDSRKYVPYVAHRVGDALTHLQPENFRWVPTKENVADCLTKWCKDTEPTMDGRWFRGPAFLREPEANWPLQRKVAADTEEELRPRYLLHHNAVPDDQQSADRVSKWNVLVRSIGFAYRFIRNCRLKSKGLPIETTKAVGHQRRCLLRTVPAIEVPLTQSEYERSEQYLWRVAQADCFPDEVVTLQQNRSVPIESLVSIERSSPLYQRCPFADEFGVLRVDGRTANAGYASFDARFPVILPKKHRITTLILDHYHRKYGHANRETAANEVRQRYDVLSLRPMLDKIAKGCQWCRVQKAKPRAPRMAPLPEQRLTPHIRPFSHVGIDYLGPLEVTVGRRKEKRWVAVFTCLVVRAVHLEVTHSLTTDSCMMAIRRFVRACGPPVEIFTDNGTNFVGASRELQREISRINIECADTFTDAKTAWSFNPPSAPHMGGVWERMVRSVKETMRALDDGRKLTDEILLTVLAETKGFINSRPLTYMPQKPDTEEALTPNHFIFWGSSSGLHDPLRVPVDLAEALRSSYKRSQYLADSLWKRWLKEYFPTRNRRSKWFDDVPALTVGDLVYVAEGTRRTWIRGKIEEVYPGKDGRVRRAAVRTSSKQLLLRPAVKLAVIEIGEPRK